MSTLTLLDLPPEIIREICAQFCAHCRRDTSVPRHHAFKKADRVDKKTLLNLGKTCQVLYQLAWPFICHDFRFDCWRYQEVFNILLKISRDPKLASSVRHAFITTVHYIGPEWQAMKEEAIKRGLSLLEHWTTPVDQATAMWVDRDRVAQQLRHSVEILSDVLLSAVHANLEQLTIRVDNDVEYGSLLPSATELSALRALSLVWQGEYCRDTDIIYGLPNFAEIIGRAPILEKLHLKYCFSLLPDAALRPYVLALGNVTWVKLDGCVLRKEDLNALVRACPKLETFIFDCNINITSSREGTHYQSTASEIRQALLPRKDTLRHIEILLSWRYMEKGYPENAIKSMKNFSVLETLVLDIACLRSNFQGAPYEVLEDGSVLVHSRETAISLVNLLPTSIQTVVIDGNRPTYFKAKFELAEEISKGTFPHLKVFKEKGNNLDAPLRTLHDAMKHAGGTYHYLPHQGHRVQ